MSRLVFGKGSPFLRVLCPLFSLSSAMSRPVCGVILFPARCYSYRWLCSRSHAAANVWDGLFPAFGCSSSSFSFLATSRPMGGVVLFPLCVLALGSVFFFFSPPCLDVCVGMFSSPRCVVHALSSVLAAMSRLALGRGLSFQRPAALTLSSALRRSAQLVPAPLVPAQLVAPRVPPFQFTRSAQLVHARSRSHSHTLHRWCCARARRSRS